MTQTFLKTLNSPFLLFLLCIGIGIQTSLFADYPLSYLQPDLLLIAVIWFSLKREFIEGGVLTLILAHFAEIHSGAPKGLFYICYMFIYLMVRGSSRFFVISKRNHYVYIVLISSVVWKALHLLIVYWLGKGENQIAHTAMLVFPGAVVEGVLSIWIFQLLDRFDWVTFKNPKARELDSDDLRLDQEEL